MNSEGSYIYGWSLYLKCLIASHIQLHAFRNRNSCVTFKYWLHICTVNIYWTQTVTTVYVISPSAFRIFSIRNKYKNSECRLNAPVMLIGACTHVLWLVHTDRSPGLFISLNKWRFIYCTLAAPALSDVDVGPTWGLRHHGRPRTPRPPMAIRHDRLSRPVSSLANISGQRPEKWPLA